MLPLLTLDKEILTGKPLLRKLNSFIDPSDVNVVTKSCNFDAFHRQKDIYCA